MRILRVCSLYGSLFSSTLPCKLVRSASPNSNLCLFNSARCSALFGNPPHRVWKVHSGRKAHLVCFPSFKAHCPIQYIPQYMTMINSHIFSGLLVVYRGRTSLVPESVSSPEVSSCSTYFLSSLFSVTTSSSR